MSEFRRDILVYLAGPITAKDGRTIEQNTANALKVYLECLRRGIPAFCPHLSAAFPSAFSTVEYDVWLEYDKAIIDRCSHMLMLYAWETSNGAMLEWAYAKSQNIPVVFSLDDIQ